MSDQLDSVTYTKCLHCHLFVEENYSAQMYPDQGYAPYTHLHQGTPEDEAIEETHDAEPGETNTLAWWKANGPAEMKLRFV